jgi:hypothetical protein
MHLIHKQNIAIIKSAPKKQLIAAISEIRRRFQGVCITVIMQEDFVHESKEYQSDRIICSHRNGRFGIFRIGWRRLMEIKSEGYKEVVLLYNNPEGRHCWNIDLLGIILGGRKWVFDSDGRFYPMKSLRWVFNILFYRIFNNLLLSGLFISFLPLLLILGLIKKIGKSVHGKSGMSFEELKRFGG